MVAWGVSKTVHPQSCVAIKPRTNAIKFNGEFIHLRKLEEATGIHHTHLSRIFSGARRPSLLNADKISMALGITVDNFIHGMNKRMRQLKADGRRPGHKKIVAAINLLSTITPQKPQELSNLPPAA